MTHETIFDFDEETECCNKELIDWNAGERISISLEKEEAFKYAYRNSAKKDSGVLLWTNDY